MSTADVMLRALDLAQSQLDNYKTVDAEWKARQLPKSACVLVLNDEGKILSVSRRGAPLEYGLPGGKVDSGELYVEAAVRELSEETGLFLTHHDVIMVYAGDDGHGYYVTTFMCERIVRSSDVRQMESDMAVNWITPAELLSGPFVQYNSNVLQALLRLVRLR